MKTMREPIFLKVLTKVIKYGEKLHSKREKNAGPDTPIQPQHRATQIHLQQLQRRATRLAQKLRGQFSSASAPTRLRQAPRVSAHAVAAPPTQQPLTAALL
jgi:hypothetical protein